MTKQKLLSWNSSRMPTAPLLPDMPRRPVSRRVNFPWGGGGESAYLTRGRFDASDDGCVFILDEHDRRRADQLLAAQNDVLTLLVGSLVERVDDPSFPHTPG